MGFLILLFVFVVIAVGMYGMFRLMSRPFRDTTTAVTQNSPPDRPDLPDDPKMRAILQAMYNEGYFGIGRLNDEDITYVTHPILTGMLTQLDTEQDIAWILPKYRLRLRAVPNTAPDWVSEEFTHVVMSPTHAFGVNRYDR